MECNDFREFADSYLSDELLVETNHEVISHLESCADCRREMAARRELRGKLREGFQNAPDLQLSDEFAAKLEAQLREVALRHFRFSTAKRAGYIGIAAALVIAAALGLRVLYQRRHSQNLPSLTNVGNQQPDDAGDLVAAALSESAIGDHRDCALNHRLAEKPIDLDEAGRKYDRAYINLVSAVMSGAVLPDGVELVAKHSCVFKGRRFGHVILKYHGQLVSVLVTKIEGQDRGAASSAADQLFTSSQSDGYQLTKFMTERHGVFVVSGLNASENLSIARAIEPSVSSHIKDVERTI